MVKFNIIPSICDHKMQVNVQFLGNVVYVWPLYVNFIEIFKTSENFEIPPSLLKYPHPPITSIPHLETKYPHQPKNELPPSGMGGEDTMSSIILYSGMWLVQGLIIVQILF